MDLSSRMPGVRLVLHDEGGKYQGVARVLKYEGHMLVYDPQTNGVGWAVMRGIPSLLTEVELRSASDLGNFYPILSAVPAGPKATQSPPGEPTVQYKQTETETPRPMAGDLDKYIEWDTDDVQDRSHTPSPTAVIDEPTQGESTGRNTAHEAKYMPHVRACHRTRGGTTPGTHTSSGGEEHTTR